MFTQHIRLWEGEHLRLAGKASASPLQLKPKYPITSLPKVRYVLVYLFYQSEEEKIELYVNNI
jgi:hypothetical protein